MNTLIIYEAGVRTEQGKYTEFISSPDRKKVEDYIELMKECKPEGMVIVFLEKTYHLVTTTPHIISAG